MFSHEQLISAFHFYLLLRFVQLLYFSVLATRSIEYKVLQEEDDIKHEAEHR